MINFQRPAFPNLEIFCNKLLHTKLLCQFWAVHSYGTRNTRTRKQNCLKLLYTEISSSLVCFAYISSYLSVTCWHLLVISSYISCVSTLCSLYIMRILLHRVSLPLHGGSLNRWSTVSAAKIFLLFQQICIAVEQVREKWHIFTL